jgi:hypothetical protein
MRAMLEVSTDYGYDIAIYEEDLEGIAASELWKLRMSRPGLKRCFAEGVMLMHTKSVRRWSTRRNRGMREMFGQGVARCGLGQVSFGLFPWRFSSPPATAAPSGEPSATATKGLAINWPRRYIELSIIHLMKCTQRPAGLQLRLFYER